MHKEMQKNIIAYEKIEAELLKKHYGKTALLSNGELIKIYDEHNDAYKAGLKNHGEGKFSIKKINTDVARMGGTSYGLRNLHPLANI